ncbi:MAG: hypothetical protein JSW55_03610 [Chloroflexota bacterium]|nr:MAG: hypothetical protein JSW55_03610 [Chloroflexota bacterium]
MKGFVVSLFVTALSLVLVTCGGADAMDPSSVSIDTMDLGYSWQANLVEETAYDDSQPPGPMGLPEHVQVNFGISDRADVQFGDPIIYIIPTEAYQGLWDEAGNSAVSDRLAMLEELLADRSDLATARLPVLPFEAYRVMGAGNLAVTAQREYVDTPWGSGVRFVAAPMQGIDVILNRNVVYIEQGLTDDGAYLVSFFYPPVATSALPNDVGEVTEEEFQQAHNDPNTYLQEKERMLNELEASDWEPDLTTLDEVISSLQFGNYGS